MAGSNNYNFRSGSMSTGQRISLAGANRNYTLRGMYTYNSGFNAKGWAFSAGLTYRWANRGYVEGTFLFPRCSEAHGQPQSELCYMG